MLKQILIFIILTAICIVFPAKVGHAQGAGTPEQLVYDFYVWYGENYDNRPVAEMNDEIYNYVYACTVNRCRLDFLKACTDSNYFVKGNAVEKENFTTIIIGKAVPVGDGVMIVPATLRIPWYEKLPNVIAFVRKEEGKWRIIKVENWRS